ncbi:MAG: DUF5946 family protein [Pyrinomonadaceae bacterium]
MDFTAYDELCAFTLSIGRGNFVHQHVVDAHAAQTATPAGKPIRIFFALVGLYLHLEHGFTGSEVQLAHMKLAGKRREWPEIELPSDRGSITAADVLAVEGDDGRIAMIDDWCGSVWYQYGSQRDKIASALRNAGII